MLGLGSASSTLRNGVRLNITNLLSGSSTTMCCGLVPILGKKDPPLGGLIKYSDFLVSSLIGGKCWVIMGIEGNERKFRARRFAVTFGNLTKREQVNLPRRVRGNAP
jgi:hypothetical protein